MPATCQWIFGPFRLDPTNHCLWHGSATLALKPKTLAVLHYLVEHAGHLVTKAALLDAVWPETAVSDTVVKVCIADLRKALGDRVQAPQFIATAHRHGYRFVAPVTQVETSEALPPSPSATVSPSLALPAMPPYSPLSLAGHSTNLLVEREAVLAQLHTAWKKARRGQRQVVLVTGEAGIGKTAVVETFVAQIATQETLWLAFGQCVEHYGPGEAYLPILEAFGQLCRGPDGTRLVALLRQQAPTWLVQMPWLLTVEDRSQLQTELQGATRERMLRECADVMDALTAEVSLLLVLEDLHWSDTATVDLLALLARRRTSSRLLVLGTYRPVEVRLHHHPLQTMLPDVQRQGYATEISLTALSPAAVATYLAVRFPQQQFPATLGPGLQQRTGGNPLFLVTLVQAFVEQGLLRERDGKWVGQEELAMHLGGIPASLRQVLEHQLLHLEPALQQVLEGASVAGVEFVAAAVAASLDADAAGVEEQCEALVVQQFLRPLGVTTWPDGTVATRYAFRHALYQQVAYERLGAGRRVRLHRRLGAYLEAVYGAQADEMAAELAEHSMRGQETRRAVRYLHQAAKNASRRYAHREVIELLTRALGFLQQLPATPARTQLELDLQMPLGSAMIALKGHAAAEVEETYARAHVLCQLVGETPQLFPTLRGLYRFYQGRGALQTALEIGEHLWKLAQHTGAPMLSLNAHEGLGTTLFHLGKFAAALTHLNQGIALIDPALERAQALRYGEAPGVRCLIFAALTLWCLGFPAQALQRSREGLALAQELVHPHSVARVQHYEAFLHYFRREALAFLTLADALLALAIAQGFPVRMGYGTFWQGWALTMQGQDPVALTQMRQGLAAIEATGQTVSHCLVVLAASLGHVGQVDEGLRLLTEALEALEATGRGDMLAEAYRLQGTLLLRQDPSAAVAVEACFQHALEIARRQQAKSWELRTATSLARLWQQQGRQEEARQLLVPVYDWFTEGFETVDLQEARTLLEDLETVP